MRRILLLLLVSSTAYAGGTTRPNAISARGVGMGGAWAAWADDATAIYFNPGALDTVDSHVLLGVEYVVAPRSYTPMAADGTLGEPQATVIALPVPALGVVGRFNTDDEPSRFTLGLGLFNTFGGSTRYDKTGMPALDATQDLCLEVQGAVGVHISDRLSVGAAARLGIGLFHVESTMNPFDSDLSASGVGASMTVGALVRPTDSVRVGLTWRAPMRFTLDGSGTVDMGDGPQTRDVRHYQNWPQAVLLGVGIQATPVVKLAFELDWHQWSQMHTIDVIFPNGELPDQHYPAYWNDNYTVRAGGEYAFSPRFALRAGTYFDTQAVPDRTIERQYPDTNKLGVAVGAGLRAGDWRFDMAIDGVIPRKRTVEHNQDEVMGFTVLQNKAPGEYLGTVANFELAAARQF